MDPRRTTHPQAQSRQERRPAGGDDRGCFEGILWILRTGARWKDLPKAYPSPTTCWRRLNEWERDDVWLTLWRSFIAQLDQQGQSTGASPSWMGRSPRPKKGALCWPDTKR